MVAFLLLQRFPSCAGRNWFLSLRPAPQLTCRGEVSSIRAIALSSGTRRTLSMKQFCVLLLALAVGCSLLALSPKSKESGGGVEKTITQLEDASRDAALKGDPSWAEKNVADDFVR